METVYVQERIRAVKRRVMWSSQKEMFWNDTTGELRKSFVGLMKIYVDKKEVKKK